MRIIGLTGGIACGKSNVSSVLAGLGAVIIDGDVISRTLTAPQGQALPALRDAFGPGIFAPDGTLDRAALGRLIFTDSAAREQLDAVMQPLIIREIHAQLDAARARGETLAVLDMPLLFEKELDRLCDRVWCVYIPPEEQLSRLMARNGYTRSEAQARMDSQMSAAEKARRADLVIDTGGTIDETRASIPALYAEEIRLAQAGEGGAHGNKSHPGTTPADPQS